MKKFLHRLFNHRVRALVQKEFRQIRRDRRLAISLILPPTLQLLLFGFALSATVSNIRLGVVDDSGTPESRELVANLTESKSFQFAGSYLSVDKLGAAISRGDLDAGVVIPYDYARDLYRGNPSTVQFLLNAMNANTAAIAQGYAQGVIQSYNQGLAAGGIHASFRQIAAADVSRRGIVSLHPAYLFNPGLVASWFIVTGVFGLLLILNGSIVASAAMVKERERGTIEQLIVTPIRSWELILAKIIPYIMVSFADTILILVVGTVVFGVPIRGSLLLLFALTGLYLLPTLGYGLVISTVAQTQQQAQLMIMPLMLPAFMLSGYIFPITSLPVILQYVGALLPTTYFIYIMRAVVIKGVGLDLIIPQTIALSIFAVGLLALAVWRFRKSLD